MTDKEVLDELRSNSALNRARAVLSSHCGLMEQMRMSPIEMRRIEFETVQKIALILKEEG